MAAESVANGHPTETWAALVGSVGVVVALVSVLYNRINSDIKSHDTKLDAGTLQFQTIGSQLIRVGEQMVSVTAAYDGSNEELDRLDTTLRELHNRLLVIETEHKHCQEIVRGIGR